MKTSTSTLALIAALLLVPTTTSVVLAAGPFNEAQARQKIESAGYTQISGLHEGDLGEWMGDGTRDGKVSMIVLDSNGTVTPTANTASATAASTAGIQVEQMPAQVTVKQAQPDITVTQGQPTITVHQPAPIVTVEIPQPEITVHMPKPNVAVSMAQPQVEVNQPKPKIQIAAAAPAQVDVQPSKADVTMQQTQAAPVIRYDADQAKVNIKQSPGNAHVKIVDADATPGQPANSGTTAAVAAAPVVAAVPATQASAAPGTSVQISRVLNMNVTNMHGDVLGDIEHVVKHSDGKDYVVIGHGGFLGLDQKHVALPLDKMVMRNGRMEMRGMTDDQIKAMKSYDGDDHNYTDLQNNGTIQVNTAT